MRRNTVIASLAVLTFTLAGCTSDKASAPPPAPPVAVQAKPNFVPPTAEEAYRLQDDCTRRGEKILRDNMIGSALTHEQVPRYNATTNRCYVRLEVHAMNLSQWDQYDNSTYLEDGQTDEMRAFIMIRKGRQKPISDLTIWMRWRE
jgi:hypothetical protein